MHILLVDDDSDDQILFCEALKMTDPSSTCEVAGDGEVALEKLATCFDLPDRVFLDINMPKMDGRACLRAIRADRRLMQLSVTVISTSISPQDKSLFATLGADHIVKPNEFGTLIALLRERLFFSLEGKEEEFADE
jgi:CheY-like chemotaxis protein